MKALLKKIVMTAVSGMMFCLAADNVQVMAKGIPGKTMVSVGESWLDKIMQEQPDLVIMLYGTNDACNSRYLATPEKYEEKLNAVVRRILSKSKLILVTIPPCNEKYLLKRHKVSAYGTLLPMERIKILNGIIAKTAKANNIPLADFYSVAIQHGVEGKDSYLSLPETGGATDGVHLSERGYAVLAEMIADTIRKAGYTPKKILCIGDSLTYGIGTKDAGKVSGSTYPGVLNQILNK